MVEWNRETLLTLKQAARRLPAGVHHRTIYRWAVSGLRGHRLDVVWIGGTMYTSTEALDRFIRDYSAARMRADAIDPPRRRDMLATKARLALHGV